MAIYPTLQWYKPWLRDQVSRQPTELFNCIPAFNRESDDSFDTVFAPFAEHVYHAIAASSPPSIDSIIENLLKDEMIDVGTNGENVDAAVDLVFAMVGWYTMLYKPDFHSCPPSELCIADEMDGHLGEGHMCLKQNRANSNKRLSDFLLGFGLMLPPKNYQFADDGEEIKVANRIKTAESSSLNIHLLQSVGRLTIEWTDSLACHLELDKDTHTLYIFRYPSFCLANLATSASGTQDLPLHSCTSDVDVHNLCATDQDITELLTEVILSYRLLFGQDSRSRKLFHKLKPFDNVPRASRDHLLAHLCTKKELDHAAYIIEKSSYELKRDLPHLRSKIARLCVYISQRKPRSWKDLWMDNRDSASWLTFWAVIIFGGLGILLAFIQVVLQVVQLSLQVQQPN